MAEANGKWAAAYAAAGFAVLPIWWGVENGAASAEEIEKGEKPRMICACEKGAECERPAKHPIPKKGVNQATKDPARVAAWWSEYPDANVALATGEVSGVILIDVDVTDGKVGDVALTEACADAGGVPRTVKARSGSGGAHYFYAYRSTPFTRKIGFLRNVDYLADGGYVVVQPSANLKGAYAFDAEAKITGPSAIKSLRKQMAELPAWFDKLEGKEPRRGRKGRGDSEARAEERRRSLRARVVNSAAMEFKASDPKWIAEIQRALTFCDPDSRDDWVLFGIILGREFARSDDGWAIYNTWAARSAKFEDKGTAKAMRGYYYDDSLDMPQGGEPATIATILSRAAEGGWTMPFGGLDQRPVIAYRAGRAIETVNEVLTLLSREREAASDASRIYAFGNGLGSIIESHDHGATYTPEGRPPNGWVLKVSPYTSMSLGSRITHTATIVKFTASGTASQVECPTEVSTLLLSDHAKHFPRLNGIVQWPMVIDGEVAGFEADYEPRTGLVFALPEGFEMGKVKGTRAEAEEAWRWVRGVALAEFPFASERDEAAALALLLTFMQRRAMREAPAFLITAPTQGSGKTALAFLASRAIHGRSVGASAWSRVDEEQRKSITAALLNNPPAILYDNLKQGTSFDSAELAIAMTSGEWEDRKLGESARLILPNRAVWVFTGNNVALKADLKRRFIVIRMVPKVRAHYEQHFSRQLDSWAIEHREEMLRALVPILVHGARSKVELSVESGFSTWDAQVRKAVLAVTGVDPFRSKAEATEEEDEDENESAGITLAKAWALFVGEKRAVVSDFLEAVDAAKKGSDSQRRTVANAVDGAVAALREKEESRLGSADYGYAIRLLQDKLMEFEGLALVFQREGSLSKVAAWKLEGAAKVVAALSRGF